MRAARSYRSGNGNDEAMPSGTPTVSQQSAARAARFAGNPALTPRAGHQAQRTPLLWRDRMRARMRLPAWHAPCNSEPMIPRTVACIVCALCACLLSGLAVAQSWQSLDSIRDAAVERVRSDLSAGSARRSVEADALDERLHLAACDVPLEAFMPPGGRRGA